MARISVHQPDGTITTIPISPAISLVNTLLKAGIPIRHRCGGKADCGTCRLRVISTNRGKQSTNTIGLKEDQRLRAIGAHPEQGERLACQTYIYADCDVYLFS
jgi:ferredoxin